MVRVLVTGTTGLLGPYVEKEALRRGQTARGVLGPKAAAGVDLADRDAAAALFEKEKPHVVIHCAALSAIGDCVADPARARRVNVEATANLAALSSKTGARLVHVSSDLVFDGEEAPYGEAATPKPLSIYGTTKHEAEAAALACAAAVVVRVALLYGPTLTARKGFFDSQVEALQAKKPIGLFEDEWRTPLSLQAAAEGLVSIAEGAMTGMLHLGGPERMSRLEMGQRLARFLAIESPTINAGSRLKVPGEPRPKDVSLDSSKFHRFFPAVAKGTFEEECTRMMRAR